MIFDVSENYGLVLVGRCSQPVEEIIFSKVSEFHFVRAVANPAKVLVDRAVGWKFQSVLRVNHSSNIHRPLAGPRSLHACI